ncbi:nucleophile aminohydrolase [Hysterangium stoloniferum]|nr:nucleophile aminohydrolase [Hysterangium stoloniferum]
MPYYVVVHGGAGYHSHASEKAVKKSLHRSCSNAIHALESNQEAVEGVETAIIELEDSEILNAGYGSNLTYQGTVECDAAVMDDSGRFGSVGAVSGIKNPIRAAKAIFDYSSKQDPLGRVPPLTLVSNGAYEFAVSSSIPTIEPRAMVSPRANDEWNFWRNKHQNHHISVNDRLETASLMQDTVGCVVFDQSGGLAAGVSSGGLLLKLPGRLGEAAVFGAGCWARKTGPTEGAAISVSGTGEAIVRTSLAHALSEAVCSEDPHDAIQQLISQNFIEAYTSQGETSSAGAVILQKESNEKARLWCVFNTASMSIAYASSESSEIKVF